MSGIKLYLMVGYPGAGKSTVANIIHQTTGAIHLMADRERHNMFDEPTHSPEESHSLYDALNQKTDKLLSEGNSVVFDTNFNFYSDRKKLRQIAAKHKAVTTVVWIRLDKDLAKSRAVGTDYIRNGYKTSMTEEHFEEIVSKLEPPREDENVIKIDGAKLDKDELVKLFSQ